MDNSMKKESQLQSNLLQVWAERDELAAKLQAVEDKRWL